MTRPDFTHAKSSRLLYLLAGTESASFELHTERQAAAMVLIEFRTAEKAASASAPGPTTSLAHLKTKSKELLKGEWNQSGRDSQRGGTYQKPQTEPFVDRLKKRNRRDIATLVQLTKWARSIFDLTGKGILIGKAERSDYRCTCERKEIPQHLLLDCHNSRAERTAPRKTVL